MNQHGIIAESIRIKQLIMELECFTSNAQHIDPEQNAEKASARELLDDKHHF